MAEPRDSDLISACLAGSQSAWDQLVERFSRLVYSIPHKLGFSAGDADDVFQTVFTIVLRRLSDLRDHDRFAGWLIRTTYRECWRHRKSRIDVNSHPAHEPAMLPDEEVEALERQHMVRSALTRMDQRCRDLLEALFFEEHNGYEEISERLGMPVGSIGPTRARCFSKMEAILSEFGL